MALAAFSPGFVMAVWFWPSSLQSMKRWTASVILALAVVAGAPGGLALAQQLTREHIETAIDALENEITVAPENRCTPYDPKDYSYDSRELKDALMADWHKDLRELYTDGAITRADLEKALGEIWSNYTDEIFTSLDEADLDHLVALSEAHDSGACAWRSKKRRFLPMTPVTTNSPAPG